MVQPLHENRNLKFGFKLHVSFKPLPPENTYGFGSTVHVEAREECFHCKGRWLRAICG